VRHIPFGKPMIGDAEKKAVSAVLEGPILVHGPKARQFESDFADFAGAQKAVSVSSCTAGMHLVYFDLGIGPGDEVILPAQTHCATAHAVEFCGAKPVFVDSEPETGNINIDMLEHAITDRTKAIGIVHYLGVPVDMERVTGIVRKHGLFLLEDCALAVGTYHHGIHAGLHGDAGCFSFYPVKHMTTAEGGMIITRHKEIGDRLDKKKAFGVDRTVGERKIPGVYDVNMLGYNYRMNELQAAIGIEQLKKIDHFLIQRKTNYEVLKKGLSQIDEIELLGQIDAEDHKCSYYCLTLVLKDRIRTRRTDIIKALNEKGIGTSIYYPKPVPCMAYYRQKYGYIDSQFPVAARISYQSVALPVGPHLDENDMEYIAEMMKKTIAEV